MLKFIMNKIEIEKKWKNLFNKMARINLIHMNNLVIQKFQCIDEMKNVNKNNFYY